MKRAVSLFGVVALVGVLGTMATARPQQKNRPLYARTSASQVGERPICDENNPLCTEVFDAMGYEGKYTGHDEPSVLFYSNAPGSGNSNLYHVQIPKEPPTLPTQDGSGGTFNFQLHPALWFGMALCDNQSAPEYTHEPCTPNSDTNIFDGADPNAPDYIGFHPGTAFLEVQFYPPGGYPQPLAFSCDPTRWCASVAIFSLNLDMNNNVVNNDACLQSVGLEPANFAFITKDGVPIDPAGPMEVTFEVDPNRALMMNSGDNVALDIHDTPDGLFVGIQDRTTHQSGSMTAGTANGFAQIVFDLTATTCTELPYAFHPMYSTSSEHTRVPWAAHSYNVAFSDEIGHFEYCDLSSGPGGDCLDPGVNDPGGLDGDDAFCFNPSDSTLVQIGGCLDTDNDFDGVSYQFTWPGSLSDRGQDRRLNPSPIKFTSPLFNGNQNYDRIAFEADLPRIEAADFGGLCNRTTGENCVNPPPGANFYPIFTTRVGGEENTAARSAQGDQERGCLWQFGGTHIPGTGLTFGGNSTAEFGPQLQSVYPGAGFLPVFRINNFRNVLSPNPCRAVTGRHR